MNTSEREFVLNQMNVSPEVVEKLDAYVSLLNEWQRKMNLISSNTLSIVWTRHILDSAQVYKYIEPQDKVIMDFGSGAGFPALVLSIMDQNQQLDIHLVESDGKKCQFLDAVKEKCKLNVTIHNERIENLPHLSVNIITARALAALDKLISYASPFMTWETRCIFLKGKKASEEINEAKKKWMFDLEKHQSVSSDEGQILILSKVKKK